MPPPGRISEALFRASLHLLVIVIPFTVMAIPVITQEFARSPTAAHPEGSKLTHKEIFDIVFGILLLLFLFGTLAWVGGFPFPPFVFADWLFTTFRPMIDALSYLRLRAFFQRAADAIVGTARAGAAPAAPRAHEGDTSVDSVTAPTASHQPPTGNAEPGGSQVPATHRCVSSASEATSSSHLASSSSA